MAVIAYRVVNGIAIEVRFVPDGYQAQTGESLTTGDSLPSLDSLSDPVIAAKNAKLLELAKDLEGAMYGNVAYMSTTFQADAESVRRLNAALTVFNTAGAAPAGFYWVDSANNQVAMTLAQLQGLAQSMLNQGWTAFQHFQTLRAQVLAATTVSAVQAITW